MATASDPILEPDNDARRQRESRPSSTAKIGPKIKTLDIYIYHFQPSCHIDGTAPPHPTYSLPRLPTLLWTSSLSSYSPLVDLISPPTPLGDLLISLGGLQTKHEAAQSPFPIFSTFPLSGRCSPRCSSCRRTRSTSKGSWCCSGS